MAMATTSPTQTNATAFAPQPVTALVASEYAEYVQKMVLSAHEQREYDETEWLLVLADAIEAIESTTPTPPTTTTSTKPVPAILQALVEEAFSHETQATAIVSQLGDELVRASRWVLNDQEKIASLEEALDETQHALEQRNAQVAALEAALMEAKANATAANENTDSQSDTESSTGSSSTDSKRAPSRGLRKTTPCSSSSSSGSARPSWNSSTRGKIEHASRPAASRVRARASMSTAISTATATATTTTGGPTTTATRTKTAAQRTMLQAKPKPKKVSKPAQPTQPPQSKTQGPKPKRIPMPTARPQPPTPLPHLEWSVLQCAAEQARAGHSLSLILQQLQEISAWRVYFVENELWVLLGDRTSAVSLGPIDSASVVHALAVQTKLLDALKRDCQGKLRGVSHVSRDRPLLVERQQKLLGEIAHVRTLVTDLITTLREVAGCEEEEDEVADQEHFRVWQFRMTVAPKPMMSSVREQLAQRAMVNVSMTALQSVEVAVRGFHIDCLGEWAASLQTDDIHVSDVEVMELGVIVLGEVKTRIEKQVKACQWLCTSAPLAVKFKDAVLKIEGKLVFFSKALARSQDLYWCEGLLEQLASETETVDVHTV